MAPPSVVPEALAPPTITHSNQRKTTDAILSTGIRTIVAAGLTVLWTIFWAWWNHGKDEKRREKADREDKERRYAAEEDLELLVAPLRKDLDELRRDFDATRPEAKELLDLERRDHKTDLYAQQLEIEELRGQVRALRHRLMRRSRVHGPSGWAPGGSGETSTATGG